MALLTWDNINERYYETGVDRGVLYIPNAGGFYTTGYAWNGLTTVTETPTGAEATPMYADNIKYLNLLSVEELEGTIEAMTYPAQFAACDGTAQLSTAVGAFVGQQTRTPFGLSFRTRLGNDSKGDDFGYKLHLIYGCLASPSERAYATINDSPEAITFSWTFTTTGVPMPGGLKNSSLITIDSTKATSAGLTALENVLYGASGEPELPTPAQVVTILGQTNPQTVVTTVAPTFAASTGVITLPSPAITGVSYYRADNMSAPIATATTTIATAGASLRIIAKPSSSSYVFSAGSDEDWVFTRNP